MQAKGRQVDTRVILIDHKLSEAKLKLQMRLPLFFAPRELLPPYLSASTVMLNSRLLKQ